MSTNPIPNSPAPADAEELVTFIVEAVREHHKRNQRRVDGSFLAHLVRSKYPEIDYPQIGLTRLADAVRIAVARGQLVRHEDVKHLEVSPPATVATAPAIGQTSDSERLYVRPDLWRAVMFSNEEPAFIEMQTTEITYVPSGEIPQYQEDPKYVSVPKIAEDDQIGWAKQFLQSRTESPSVSIDDPKDLVKWRKKFPRSIARDWKAFRSAKVVNFVRRWAIENSLPTERLLVPPRRSPKDEQRRYEPEIRKALAAAIKEMPLSEIENLAIPLRYVLRHFQPR